MSKNDRDPARIAKEFGRNFENNEKGHLNTLATYSKLNRYNKLYEEGFSLGRIGSNIEDRIELVEQNGEMVPKKNHRNFLAGYREGLKYYQPENADNVEKKTGLSR